MVQLSEFVPLRILPATRYFNYARGSLASLGPTRRLLVDSVAYITLCSPQSGPRIILAGVSIAYLTLFSPRSGLRAIWCFADSTRYIDIWKWQWH